MGRGWRTVPPSKHLAPDRPRAAGHALGRPGRRLEPLLADRATAAVAAAVAALVELGQRALHVRPLQPQRVGRRHVPARLEGVRGVVADPLAVLRARAPIRRALLALDRGQLLG